MSTITQADRDAIQRLWSQHVRSGSKGALQDFAESILEYERERVGGLLSKGPQPGSLHTEDKLDIPSFLRDAVPESDATKAVTCLVMSWPMRIILDPTLKPGEMLLVQRPPKFFLDPQNPTDIKQCTCEYHQGKGSTQWACEVHGFIRSKP